jgi:ABC-type lipoprotein release transport system permease subunit
MVVIPLRLLVRALQLDLARLPVTLQLALVVVVVVVAMTTASLVCLGVACKACKSACIAPLGRTPLPDGISVGP